MLASAVCLCTQETLDGLLKDYNALVREDGTIPPKPTTTFVFNQTFEAGSEEDPKCNCCGKFIAEHPTRQPHLSETVGSAWGTLLDPAPARARAAHTTTIHENTDVGYCMQIDFLGKCIQLPFTVRVEGRRGSGREPPMKQVFPILASNERQGIASASEASHESSVTSASRSYPWYFSLPRSLTPMPKEKQNGFIEQVSRIGHVVLPQHLRMVCPNQKARYPCSLSHMLTLFNGCPWFTIGLDRTGVFSAAYHSHEPTAHAVWRDASILMNYYPCVRVVIFCRTNCAEHYVVQGMRTQSGAIEFRSVPYDGEDWSGWVSSAQVPHDGTQGDLTKNTKESPARLSSKTATPAEGPSRKKSK